jgi:hypothetical protein
VTLRTSVSDPNEREPTDRTDTGATSGRRGGRLRTVALVVTVGVLAYLAVRRRRRRGRSAAGTARPDESAGTDDVDLQAASEPSEIEPNESTTMDDDAA